jgi:hypothetical protein
LIRSSRPASCAKEKLDTKRKMRVEMMRFIELDYKSKTEVLLV